VALRQALTLAEQAGKIVLKDVTTTGKTSEIVKFLADNKFDRKVLIVVDEKTPELIRATANIQNVLLIRSTYLSVYYILNADKIVIAPSAIATIKSWLIKEEA
jgi:large subunit ribosomal protein L4